MSYPYRLLLILIFQVLLLPCLAAETFSAQKYDSLFQSDEVINMQLTSDFTAIDNDRDEDPDYHEGVLSYLSGTGDTVKFTLRIKARGNFRLNPVNCKFPPLLLNFKKKDVKNTLFENQNKLKLVTPCQLEEDILKEYIIYKMYNLVTDVSHQVRLVRMLYYDTGRDKKVFEKYSFFIEDEDHVAERNGGFERDKFITLLDMNQDNVKKMTVFQYIIGNKDWYETTRHNIVIIQPDDTTQAPYALPYDFDFSEFINADYTKPKGVPDEMLEKRRVYKGLCYSPEEFEKIFEFYRKLRPEFNSLIMNQDGISKYGRKQAVKYLDEFYYITENKDLFKKEFLDQCKTRQDYYKFEK
jgi:hypothetical protein